MNSFITLISKLRDLLYEHVKLVIRKALNRAGLVESSEIMNTRIFGLDFWA